MIWARFARRFAAVRILVMAINCQLGFHAPLQKKGKIMKKILMLVTLCSVFAVAGCCGCEKEPIVEQNHKLIVPPNFGNKPAA